MVFADSIFLLRDNAHTLYCSERAIFHLTFYIYPFYKENIITVLIWSIFRGNHQPNALNIDFTSPEVIDIAIFLGKSDTRATVLEDVCVLVPC